MRTDGRTDRQTNMTQLTVTFRNLANTPKNRTTDHTITVRFLIAETPFGPKAVHVGLVTENVTLRQYSGFPLQFQTRHSTE
jgi:hypothetical protein